MRVGNISNQISFTKLKDNPVTRFEQSGVVNGLTNTETETVNYR